MRRIMKGHTKAPISRSAILKMRSSLDTIINKTTILAEYLLEEENVFRKIQGLPRRVRLTGELIEKALEQLLNSYKLLPITADLEQSLDRQEEAKENEKRSAETDKECKDGDIPCQS